MMTKKTLGILATLALACTMSLGCSDSGGDSGGGGGGTGAGGGGGGDDTTQKFKRDCYKFCERVAELGCEKEPSLAECRGHCDAFVGGLGSNTNCLPKATTLIGCKSSSNLTCDNNGKVRLNECDAEAAAVDDCLKPYLNELKCSQVCAKKVPAKTCGPDDLPTESGCNFFCEINGAAVLSYTLCWNQYKEMVDCEATNEMSCMRVGDKNIFQAEACMAKYEALNACLLKE